jgi:hypothetical protein
LLTWLRGPCQKHSVEYSINNGFLNLPKGYYIHLEKQAKEYILRNIKDARLTKTSLISKIEYFEADTDKKLTLANFMEHYGYSLNDVYGKNGDRSFSRMKAEAGLMESFDNRDEEVITKRFKNLFHMNSREFIEFATRVLALGESIKAAFSYFEESKKPSFREGVKYFRERSWMLSL